MAFRFIKNKRDNDLLVYDGLTLRKDKSESGSTYRKRIEYDKFKCRTRCIAFKGILINYTNDRNHAPSVAAVK